MREFTNIVFEKIEDGLVDKEAVLKELLLYISERDVEDFVKSSYLFEDFID